MFDFVKIVDYVIADQLQPNYLRNNAWKKKL